MVDSFCSYFHWKWKTFLSLRILIAYDRSICLMLCSTHNISSYYFHRKKVRRKGKSWISTKFTSECFGRTSYWQAFWGSLGTSFSLWGPGVLSWSLTMLMPRSRPRKVRPRLMAAQQKFPRRIFLYPSSRTIPLCPPSTISPLQWCRQKW